MQEIEDFLSRTAKLCESDKTEGQSEVGQEFRQDDTWEHLMDQETNASCNGAAKSEDCNHELEVESTEEMSDRKQRSENQGFPSRFAVEHIVDCVNQNCDSRIIDKYADINHLISETASMKTEKIVRSDIDYFKNVENTENETINDIGLDRETKDKVTFSRRARSLDSGLSAPSLSRSPIKIVGTDTDEEVIANVPKNVSEEAAQSQAAAFYLSESLLRGQTGSVNISEQQEIHNTLAMNALKAVNNSENEFASKDIDLGKDFPNREIVQRRARSLGNDLYRGGTALPKESLCSFDNYPNQELENGVRLSEEIKANTSVTDIVRNREDSRVADSSALDKLFAKLPPLSVYGRSNSQDSSLSEDSFEGIEDSGVESDFRPSYSYIDPSEQLKSLLGIKPQGNMNVRENNGSQSRSVNAGSGSLQGGKDLKKILKPDDVRPVGRGIITRACK